MTKTAWEENSTGPNCFFFFCNNPILTVNMGEIHAGLLAHTNYDEKERERKNTSVRDEQTKFTIVSRTTKSAA